MIVGMHDKGKPIMIDRPIDIVAMSFWQQTSRREPFQSLLDRLTRSTTACE